MGEHPIDVVAFKDYCGPADKKGQVHKLLTGQIAEYVSIGCLDASKSLGIRAMPEGYALMLNGDRTHFFWLRQDGTESAIHWNKWAIYHWAKNDLAKSS